ncbi:hypothetical protein EJ110_NYTH24173 [Nymphaea thermarum]|nr:hypothetical protein EJ110_NYTH24173 [Nymphaea thermarum]
MYIFPSSTVPENDQFVISLQRRLIVSTLDQRGAFVYLRPKITGDFLSLSLKSKGTDHEPHPPYLQMGWLHSLLSPLKKVWSWRLHSAKRKSRGIYILYEDVKSCSCEDVQVLWSILVESHAPAFLPSPINESLFRM